MAFNISYIYKAVDKFTPVTNKINRAVRKSTRRFKALQRQMRSTNATAGKFSSALGGIKSRILGIGAALTAAVGVKALVDFGFAMSKVKAVSGATNTEFRDMRILAKELGATTVFSASQAAGGMEFLARAGFSATTIISAMPSVLDLAASSALDLATAADITSNIMTGFGVKVSETNKIADIMATINASANTNVQQLGDAMKMVGPIASSMGQSIEVTAAALGALSDAGLQGSMAGTGLRRVLSELASPSKSVSKGLKSMGVDLKKINPQTNDLVTVLKELEKANLTAGNALQIFGQRGGPAFTVLVKNIPKIEMLTGKLNKSAGAAKRMAEIMRNNLLGSGKEAISAFEGLIITLGDLGLTQTLRNLAGAITLVTRGINTIIVRFPNATRNIALFVSILLAGKIAAIAYAGAVKIAAIATIGFNAPLLILVATLTAAIALINQFASDAKQLQQGEFVRTTIGGDTSKILEETRLLNLKNQGGVAGKNFSSSSRLDGEININAPAGVVNSASSKVSGATGNLGLNMAGAL